MNTGKAMILIVAACLCLFCRRIKEFDRLCSGHNDPWAKSEVLPKVSEAFRTIRTGGGDFAEEEGLRRYRFDGFGVLIRTADIARKP